MRYPHATLALLFAAAFANADAIKPSPELPGGSPWDLVELSAPPKFEWVDATSPVKSLKYAGEMHKGKPTRVFAYYGSPELPAGKKAPAMVLIHGGGGTAFKEWVELWNKRGYAAIAMDLAGTQPTDEKDAKNQPVRKPMPDGGPGQGHDDKFGHMDEPVTEHWVYHAVANVIRAHSLIRSFKEVDAGRTAVTGISWGGYLTCIVSGVDARFKAAAPVYGCGFLHEDSAWLGKFDKQTPRQKEKWVLLYEPSRYLPACHTPIFFVNGTNDFAYRVKQWSQSAELPRGDRNLRMTVNMPHSHPAGWAPPEVGLFVDSYLTGGTPLPGVGPLRMADGEITAAVRAITPLKNAAMHWTTDDLTVENKERKWSTRQIEVRTNSVRTDLPPRDATMWFLTVTDERDATVSSEVSFRQ